MGSRLPECRKALASRVGGGRQAAIGPGRAAVDELDGVLVAKRVVERGGRVQVVSTGA